MKRMIAALAFVMAGALNVAHAQSSMYPTYSATDSKISDIEYEIKRMKQVQMMNDRYITSLETRIAALEDRGSSKPKKTKAELEAWFREQDKKDAEKLKAKSQ